MGEQPPAGRPEQLRERGLTHLRDPRRSWYAPRVLRDLASQGLSAITAGVEIPTWVIAIGGLAACAFTTAVGPHGVFCGCVDCNPKLATRELTPMPTREAAEIVAALGPQGPQRGLMGHHQYKVPFDPLLADRAQAALAYTGDDLRRKALIDRLYLELEKAEPALGAIPWCDPRARTWIVVGALSGLPPAQIDRFVRSYGRS